jgi:hypothetical protein
MLPFMSLTVSKCGSKLVLAPTHGGISQHFSYDSSTQHVKSASGQVLDGQGFSLLADINGNPAQRWTLDYVKEIIPEPPINLCSGASVVGCAPDYDYHTRVVLGGSVSVSVSSSSSSSSSVSISSSSSVSSGSSSVSMIS